MMTCIKELKVSDVKIDKDGYIKVEIAFISLKKTRTSQIWKEPGLGRG